MRLYAYIYMNYALLFCLGCYQQQQQRVAKVNGLGPLSYVELYVSCLQRYRLKFRQWQTKKNLKQVKGRSKKISGEFNDKLAGHASAPFQSDLPIVATTFAMLALLRHRLDRPQPPQQPGQAADTPMLENYCRIRAHVLLNTEEEYRYIVAGTNPITLLRMLHCNRNTCC